MGAILSISHSTPATHGASLQQQQQQCVSTRRRFSRRRPEHLPMRLVCSRMQVLDGSTKPASIRRQAEYKPPAPAPATTRSSHEKALLLLLLSRALADVEVSVRTTSCVHRNTPITHRIANDLGARSIDRPRERAGLTRVKERNDFVGRLVDVFKPRG